MAKNVGFYRVAQRPEQGGDVLGGLLQGMGVDDGVPDPFKLADVVTDAIDRDLSQEVLWR
jgi:hypothetical protein